MNALWLLLSSIYLTLAVSCGPVENRNADKNGSKETKTMNTASLIEQHRVHINELVRFAWNKPDGLPLIKTGEPLTSILDSGKQASGEDVIADYRFRISETGNEMSILSNDPQYTSDYSSSLDFLVYDIENKVVRKTSVLMTNGRVDKSEIVDFLLGSNKNFYLLEHLSTKEKTTVNRLRNVEAGGTVVWQTEASTEDAGQKRTLFRKATALLREIKDNVFVQSETSGRTFVLKIDSKTGKAEEWVNLDNVVPKLFVDEALNLHYVTFIPEANNRAFVSYDPGQGKKKTRYAGAEAYPWLAFPAALDAHNNLYCAQGLSFSRLSSELSIKWTLSVNNIVLDSERLFTSYFDEANKTLVIYEWKTNGSVADTIKVPLDLAGLRLGRLFGLLHSGNFVIETYQEENRTLWEFNSKSKTLVKLPDTSQINRYQLQAASTWQVDKAGNLYLPVSSDEGLHIVKVSIAE